MKKIFCLLAVAVGFAGCLKNDEPEETCVPREVTTVAAASEISALKGFLSGNGISATEDPRGFFYTIVNPGTGGKPGYCSEVTVKYEGKLLDGTTFDSNNSFTYPLRNLILGWQEGIPLIATGGKIILYLPPSLGYGANANGSIPANSNLIFTVDLLSFR